MSENNQPDITTLTVQLLSAFVSNNSVPSESLADLIRTTRSALTEDPAANPAEADAPTYTPAVSVRKSLASPDHILSMIDGKPYKTLKRHLATHGLSGDEYRERYNLPKSYPLVAPSYSEARRAVATKLGLGRKTPPTKAAETKPAADAPAPAPAKPAAAKAAPAKPANAKASAAKSAAASAPASPAPAAEQADVAKTKPANQAKAAPARKRLSIASPAETKEKKAPAKAAKPAKPAEAADDKPAARKPARKKAPAKAESKPETAA